jgi:hypothetical protein
MRMPDPGRSQVILIGTSEYEDMERLPPIPPVKKNLEDLRATLTDPEYGIVSVERCDLLLNERKLSVVGRALKTAIADVDDMLFVYFAGHGIVGPRHELYLAMYESDLDNPGFSALPYDTLRNAVLDSKAATKVVVIDSCFSGLAIGNTMGDEVTAVVGQLDVAGTYVLTSAHRDQVALILPGEEHTSFTGRFLQFLRQGWPGGPEFITIDDVYKHLLKVMKSEGLSLPQRRAAATADLLAVAKNRLFAVTIKVALNQRYMAAVELVHRGYWGNASAALLEVLNEQVQILGDHHEDTLRTRQFLAHVKGATGSPEEAEQMLKGILAEQKAALGDDHEDTLQTRQLLAVSVAESGRRSDAVAMLRLLLPDRRRVLGPDHSSVFRTEHVLARNLVVLGQMDEAVALLRETLAGRERLLGPDHADTERTRRDLAILEKSRADD